MEKQDNTGKIAMLEARIKHEKRIAKQYQEHAGRLLHDVAIAKEELEREKKKKTEEMRDWPKNGDEYWVINEEGQVCCTKWINCAEDKLEGAE